MASIVNFPHFPTPPFPPSHSSPPPPAHHFSPPPPPHAVPPPPPPPHFIPPPPPLPPHAVPPPPPHHFSPPPPPAHPITPSPPHILPPPPPSSPDHPSTVIIIVFVSFGCIFFLAFCLFALWCFVKKRKQKTVQETDIVHAKEHLKVKEAIVQGPHGSEAVVLSIEDDISVDEEIIKQEKVNEKHLHAKSGGIASEAGKSPSHNTHNLLEHKCWTQY